MSHPKPLLHPEIADQLNTFQIRGFPASAACSRGRLLVAASTSPRCAYHHHGEEESSLQQVKKISSEASTISRIRNRTRHNGLSHRGKRRSRPVESFSHRCWQQFCFPFGESGGIRDGAFHRHEVRVAYDGLRTHVSPSEIRWDSESLESPHPCTARSSRVLCVWIGKKFKLASINYNEYIYCWWTNLAGAPAQWVSEP